MGNILRMGVIGVGIQGETHVKCLSSLPNVKVVAIADPNESRLKEIGDRYEIRGRYTDYREMLKREDLEAVAVVTPDHLHRDPVLAAVEAGKHVLVEKPLATSVEEAEEMVEAAKKAGVKMMVNFSNRWMSYMAIAKEAVESGEMGEPLYAYARLSNTIYVPTSMIGRWSRHTKLPFWLMSHTIDRVRWLFNSEVERVYAVARSKMELIFTAGSISIDAQQTMIQKATSQSFSIPGTLQLDVYGHPVGFVVEAIRHFVECVLNDEEPWSSGEDGLKVVRVSEAIVKSAELGEPVKVETA